MAVSPQVYEWVDVNLDLVSDPRVTTLGQPITFDPTAKIDAERERIAKYLKEEITRIARELPEHTVVPYRNIPKRLWPKNTD